MKNNNKEEGKPFDEEGLQNVLELGRVLRKIKYELEEQGLDVEYLFYLFKERPFIFAYYLKQWEQMNKTLPPHMKGWPNPEKYKPTED
jgi:hypothetical protein